MPTLRHTGLDRLLQTTRLVTVCWLLLVGLWSAPALGATLVYPNGMLAVEGLLAVTLILLARRGQVRPLRTYPLLLPCLGVLALSALASTARLLTLGTAFDTLRLWQHGEPMVRGLLLYLALTGQPRLTRVAWISTLAGLAALAATCVAQHAAGVSRWYPNLDQGWAGGWHPVADPRAQGLTSYTNLSAAMLAAAIACWWTPVALAWQSGSVSRRAFLHQGMLLLGGCVMVAALIYTNSRGPLLAALLAALFFCWQRSIRWGASATVAVGLFLLVMWLASPAWALLAVLLGAGIGFAVRRRRVLFPVALALCLMGGIQLLDSDVLHLPLRSRMASSGISDSARWVIYRIGLRAIREAPCWGMGDAAVGQRVWTTPEYDLHDLPRNQRNAHNQYLHWAAAEGLPVALAFCLLLFGAVSRLWRGAWWRPDPFARAVGLSVAVALTIFLLANLTDAHFWRIEGGGFFWSLLAIGLAAREVMS